MNNRAGRKNRERLQELQERNGRELARLNAPLQREKAEQDARRDYLYEARKRLNRECGPILFRLSASDPACGGARYGVFAELFEDFHPRTRPVLWRILVAQALLRREPLRVFRTHAPSTRPLEHIARVPDEEFDLLAWSTSKAPAVNADMRKPYAAAAHYIATHLPTLFDPLRQPPRELPKDTAPEPAPAAQTAS